MLRCVHLQKCVNYAGNDLAKSPPYSNNYENVPSKSLYLKDYPHLVRNCQEAEISYSVFCSFLSGLIKTSSLRLNECPLFPPCLTCGRQAQRTAKS
ncbi:unnamed protein product [Protopolystoma xenopodis]|uniref:Uncharacterized protein n=1 Tax=Protopolystoma xenopodis TaxID=117903 RepID=A0A3S5BFS1_9PLAT|nr:unnamed protein product [Protopolystoma xenopodis]